jgi:hypothetical protein
VDAGGTSRLADEALAEEIEIYSDLVLAATESPCRLTLQQIDAALGLTQPPSGSAHPPSRSADRSANDERQGHGEAADQPDHRDDA